MECFSLIRDYLYCELRVISLAVPNNRYILCGLESKKRKKIAPSCDTD
jgi:hypothetical protein